MQRIHRFTVLLVLGIGALIWGGFLVIRHTTHDWFVDDLDLRARLAVQSAQSSLVARWRDRDAIGLRQVLADMTHDGRVLGAAACSPSGDTLATSEGFPGVFDCASSVQQIARSASESAPIPLALTRALGDGGSARLSVIPVGTAEPLGYVLLAQDLGFLDRREATTAVQLVVGAGVLALVMAGLTLFAIARAKREWLGSIRRAVRADSPDPTETLPGEVKELVDGLMRERESDPGASSSTWNPARLRSVLTQHLYGERIVIVANREPYVHERDAEGNVQVLHPASGLVTALEPVLRACSGVWIAHGSGSADKETVDANDRVRVPPGEESYVVRRVWLNEREEEGYYFGFSNEGLWPLCHVADARPTFRAGDWDEYVRVNRRFADVVCEEVDVDDPIVLVQDYHFALAPKMIRERLPRATILAFWHIPWPNAERLGICPYRKEIVEGLLGSSIVGFHTQQHCNHFLEAVDSFLEARLDRESNAVVQHKRRTLVRAYPISIEWPVRWIDSLPDAATCRREIFAGLGLRPDARLGVGIDRMDYTKGLEERLLAVEELLERHPEHRGKLTFVQIAAPSRTRIPRYQELAERVVALAEGINQRWGSEGYRPVVLLRTHHEPQAVYRYYRAADFCYVSSLHDGMNLVAKEFVSSREDDAGVLVLSRFTGAARELKEALVVNPYDIRQASQALADALVMSPVEQRERMRAMRTIVTDQNVYRWAGRMLVDAAGFRQRERLWGRLARWNRIRHVDRAA